MKKEFLPYETVRDNALKLRGGAYVGNILSEYFKVLRSGQRPIFYAAVVAHSYTDIQQQAAVRVDGWTYAPEYLRSGDKVLFVDDIFDSGRTINALVNIIIERGLPRKDIKVAVHDYKQFQDAPHLPIVPDFYCRKHLLPDREHDLWIHYLSHELIGLSPEERELHYVRNDPEMADVMSVFRS